MLLAVLQHADHHNGQPADANALMTMMRKSSPAMASPSIRISLAQRQHSRKIGFLNFTSNTRRFQRIIFAVATNQSASLWLLISVMIWRISVGRRQSSTDNTDLPGTIVNPYLKRIHRSDHAAWRRSWWP